MGKCLSELVFPLGTENAWLVRFMAGLALPGNSVSSGSFTRGGGLWWAQASISLSFGRSPGGGHGGCACPACFMLLSSTPLHSLKQRLSPGSKSEQLGVGLLTDPGEGGVQKAKQS